jgi:glutamate N-acetyltransferase/amino-acid N-acetyltransferase
MSLGGAADEAIATAIERVCHSLAQQVVEDGEGRTRLMDLTVVGAAASPDARAIAEKIALSPLVKTALAGGDPQWGRIAAAVGAANIAVHPNDLTLSIGEFLVVERGVARDVPRDELSRAFQRERVCVEVRVGNGPGRAHITTTDLSKRYVEINADYTT